jgi:hypothetical protein
LIGVDYTIDSETFLVTEHKESWDIEPLEVSGASVIAAVLPEKWQYTAGVGCGASLTNVHVWLTMSYLIELHLISIPEGCETDFPKRYDIGMI